MSVGDNNFSFSQVVIVTCGLRGWHTSWMREHACVHFPDQASPGQSSCSSTFLRL